MGKASSGCLERFVLFTKAKTDLLTAITRPMVERRSRNNCDAYLADEVPCKLDVIGKAKPRDVAHNVICPIRKVAAKPRILEHRNDKIALLLIFELELVIVTRRQAESVCTGVLQRVGCTDSQEIMHLAD